WTSLFVLRHFGVTTPVALAASLLFAFLPYHFWRGTYHYFLSLYYPIPLAVMVALWILRREPLFFSWSGREGWRGSRPSGKGMAIRLVVGLISINGVYYAFFSGFLIATSGLIVLLRRRPRWPRALDAGLLLASLAICIGIVSFPFVLYWKRHGRNT